MSKKLKLKWLARYVEWATCDDIECSRLPKSVQKKINRIIDKNPKFWSKLSRIAYQKFLIEEPHSDYATCYWITDGGEKLVDKFYKY